MKEKIARIGVKRLIIVFALVFAVAFFKYVDKIPNVMLQKDVSQAYTQFQSTRYVSNYDELKSILDKQKIKYEISSDKVITEYITYNIVDKKIVMEENDMTEEFSLFESNGVVPEDFKFTKDEQTITITKYNEGFIFSQITLKDGKYYYLYNGFLYALICVLVAIIFAVVIIMCCRFVFFNRR